MPGFFHAGEAKDGHDMDIADIAEFSVQLKNSLYHINVRKASDLLKLSKRDLITTSGIGKKNRQCIADFLKEYRFGNEE